MIARLPEEKWEEVMDWAVEHSGGRWNELREMVNWVLYDLGPNEDKLVETLKGEIDLWVERHPRGTYGNAVDPIQRIAEYVAAGVERERSIHLRP